MRVLCLCWNLAHAHEFDLVLRKLRTYFGDNVTLHLFVFQAERSDMRSYFEAQGVKLHTAGLSGDAGGSKPRRLMRFLVRSVPALLGAARTSDLVFSFGSAAVSGFLALLAARLTRRSVVIRMNGAGVRHRPGLRGLRYTLLTRAEHAALKYADAVVFLSEAQRRKELGDHGLAPAARHVVVPPGVPEARFFRATPDAIAAKRGLLKVADGERLAGSIVDARPIKNLEAALRAIAMVRNEGLPVRFVLVGPVNDEDYCTRLVALAQSLGITEYFHMVGSVANAELAPWYSTFDVTLLPSHREAFGLSITESGLCGTPTIASGRGGMAEQIEDGVTGYLIDPDSPEDLARAIKAVLDDPARAETMGHAARMFVSERFTEQAAQRQFSGVLSLCGLAADTGAGQA